MDRRRVIAIAGAGVCAGMLPWHHAAAQGHTPLGYLRTNWSRDPHTFGSYSYVARGATQQDRRRLEAPVEDRLFFAGEAAHPRYNSTVHAAYESGVRVADMVLSTPAAQIAVIGAGVSGLATAQRLAAQGRTVTVFEARARIGGRIHTNHDLGVPLDLGASWIHGIRGNPITALAQDLGVRTAQTSDSYVLRGANGIQMADLDAPDWLDAVTEIQHSAGADADQINNTAYFAQRDYGGPDVVFPDGYSALFPALSGAYQTRLSAPIRAVRLRGSSVVLTLRSGDAPEFDAVIVTVSLGVLKQGQIAFDPALPTEKTHAIARLGMGTLDKIYLSFDRVFWDRDATWIITPETGLPPGYFNQWLNLYPVFNAPLLVGFNGGSPALDLANAPDQHIVDMATAVLRSAYPG